MATTTRRTRRSSADPQRLLELLALPVAALLTAVVLLGAIGVVGPLVILIPVLVAAGLYLVRNPVHALLALVFTITVFENDSSGVLGFTDRWYSFLPGLPVQPGDLLIIAIVAGLALDYNATRQAPRIHPWMWLPAPFLVAGIASGVVTGYLDGADMNTLLNSVRVFALLVVVPLMTAAVVDRFELITRLLRFWFVLVTVKCIIGVIGWFLGAGRGLGSTRITFYSPTMNFYALVVILAVLGLWVRFGRSAVTRGQWIGFAFALASLTLALRRSFWIGLVLGVIIVVLVASGRKGRPLVLLGGAALIAGAFVMLNAGGATNSDNPVVQRAEIRDDAEDRYRLDEQTNVFDELERHPLTGLGMGIPWEARHPLSLEFGAGRNYTHVAVFFFWLKLGPIGVMGYFAIIVATGVLGLRLWQHEQAHDPVLAVAGLALAVGVLALAVVELTGTFTGASDRFSNSQMILFGWLGGAVVAADLRARAATRAGVLARPSDPAGRGRPW